MTMVQVVYITRFGLYKIYTTSDLRPSVYRPVPRGITYTYYAINLDNNYHYFIVDSGTRSTNGSAQRRKEIGMLDSAISETEL